MSQLGGMIDITAEYIQMRASKLLIAPVLGLYHDGANSLLTARCADGMRSLGFRS